MIAIFPEIAACAASGDVERLAVLVRKYFGGKDTFAPKPDIEGLIRAAGLSLKQVAMSSVGALVGTDSRGKFEVVAITTDRDDQQAQRFLLAHLLGHFLLDVTPVIARGDWQQSGYKEEVCPHQRYISGNPTASQSAAMKVEERADRFAAALLLPQGMVRRALEALGSAERAAAFFGVSRGCLARRLEDLGMTMATPPNFLAAERQIGVEPPAEAPAARPMDELVNMPRSYAASTYGATERRTRRPGDEAASASRGVAPGLPGQEASGPAGAMFTASSRRPPGEVESAKPSSAGAPRGGSQEAAVQSPQPARRTLVPRGGSQEPTASHPAQPTPRTLVPRGGSQEAAVQSPQPAPRAEAPSPAQGAAPSGRGMERLRQLARQLDKGDR